MGEDKLKFDRDLYRLFLKEALCFISYLWISIQLGPLIEQLTKIPNLIMVQLIALDQIPTLMLFFERTANDSVDDSDEEISLSSFVSSAVVDSSGDASKAKTQEIVKLKDYVNKLNLI